MQLLDVIKSFKAVLFVVTFAAPSKPRSSIDVLTQVSRRVPKVWAPVCLKDKITTVSQQFSKHVTFAWSNIHCMGGQLQGQH